MEMGGKSENDRICTEGGDERRGLGIVNQTALDPGALGSLHENVHVPTVIAHAAEETVLAIDQGPRMVELDDPAMIENQDLVVVNDCL